MALLKEKKLKNGVVTTYHRIKSINYNLMEGQTLINIDSYISKEYRDREKRTGDLDKTIDTLIIQHSKSLEEGDKRLAKSLEEKIDELHKKSHGMESIYYIADTSAIVIDSIPEDISIPGIYKLLMTFDEYSDAKEV